MRGSAFSRYEQFDTSPETINQELQPAVCEKNAGIDELNGGNSSDGKKRTNFKKTIFN